MAIGLRPPEDYWIRSKRESELNDWVIPYKFKGNVVSTLEELMEIITADDDFTDVKLEMKCERPNLPGMDVYAHRFKISEILSNKVAYGCGNCKKIVIDSPRIEIETLKASSYGVPVGREGLDYYCTNCDTLIFETTFSIHNV